MLAKKGKTLLANKAWEYAAGCLGDLSIIPEQPRGVSGVSPTNSLRAASDSRKDEPRKVFVPDAKPGSRRVPQQDKILVRGSSAQGKTKDRWGLLEVCFQSLELHHTPPFFPASTTLPRGHSHLPPRSTLPDRLS